MIHITACCVRRMCLLSTRRDVDLLLFLKCDIVYLCFIFLHSVVHSILLHFLPSSLYRVVLLFCVGFISTPPPPLLPWRGSLPFCVYNNRGGKENASSFPPLHGPQLFFFLFFVSLVVLLSLWRGWSPLWGGRGGDVSIKEIMPKRGCFFLHFGRVLSI